MANTGKNFLGSLNLGIAPNGQTENKLLTWNPTTKEVGSSNAGDISVPISNIINYDVAETNGGVILANGKHNAFAISDRFLDNTIVTVYREGVGHLGNDGVIKMITSKDGGKNYTTPVTIISESGIDCRNVAFGIFNERMIVFYMRGDAVGNSLSQGYKYSDDRGVTWSAFQSITNQGQDIYSPYGKIIRTSNNRLMMSFYTENSATNETRVYCLFSDNNGASWGDIKNIITSTTQRYNEAGFTPIDGGAIIGHIRHDPSGNLLQVLSLDNGATWTNQGAINVGYLSNTAPYLDTYYEGDNSKWVVSFANNRNTPNRGIMGAVCSIKDILQGNINWVELNSLQILSSIVVGDLGYPAVIKHEQNGRFLVTYYIAESDNFALAEAKLYNKTASAHRLYDLKANSTDVTGKANLVGGNTFSGKQGINTPPSFAVLSVYNPVSVADDYTAIYATKGTGYGSVYSVESSTADPAKALLGVGSAIDPNTLSGYSSFFEIKQDGKAEFTRELKVVTATLPTSAVPLDQMNAALKFVNYDLPNASHGLTSTEPKVIYTGSYSGASTINYAITAPDSTVLGCDVIVANNGGKVANVNVSGGGSLILYRGALVSTVQVPVKTALRMVCNGVYWIVTDGVSSVINTTYTTARTTTSLNTDYPNSNIPFTVYAPNVGTGMVYIKFATSGTNQWMAYSGILI